MIVDNVALFQDHIVSWKFRSSWRYLASNRDSSNTEVRQPLVCTTELNCI